MRLVWTTEILVLTWFWFCRKPGVTGRGLYELKPEWNKHFNLYFHHYSRADQSKVSHMSHDQLQSSVTVTWPTTEKRTVTWPTTEQYSHLTNLRAVYSHMTNYRAAYSHDQLQSMYV